MTSEPLVTIEEGKLKGKTSTDYRGGNFYSFLGIPFGKPPVGELRFRAPQPAEPWTGIRDATKEGNACPSWDMYFNYYVGKEDNCLNLNVHTKELSNKSGKLKPVMFWIHGGAFLFGSNSHELYGPNYLMSEDIVFVSTNYRLGVLGFLSLKDPSLKVPGNAGLKDMVLALKWVQKNISKFGGDPQNVTIFGESAGAAACHNLVLSPMAKGLFHKAIIQSGSAINAWARAKHNSGEIARELGYTVTSEKEILKKLLEETPKSIVNAQHQIADFFCPYTIRPFGPVVEVQSEEPAFLTEKPENILEKGTFNKVPIIIGYTTREGMLFEIIRKKTYVKLPETLEAEIPYDLNLPQDSEKAKELVAKLKKYYFANQEINEQSIDSLYLLKGDNQFLYGIYKAIITQRLHTKEPIYAYNITLEGPLNYFKKFSSCKYIKTLFLALFLERLSGKYPTLKNMFHSLANMVPAKTMGGVSHADDLAYLFSTFFSPKVVLGSEEDFYIQRFLKLWTNFATHGNPTPHPDDEELNKVSWSPVNKTELAVLDIGTKLRVVDFPDQERMDFWENIFKEYTEKSIGKLFN